MSVTEFTIQNALYRRLRFDKGIIHIFPNMASITMYEADLLAVTRSGYAHEYEIKLSLSDFRADKKKREKHCSLSGDTRKIPYPYSFGTERYIHVKKDAPDGHAGMRFQCFPNHRPKYFWYVTYGFQIPEGELPAYAGLMRFMPDMPHRSADFETIKPAPKLESQKVDEKKIMRATENMLYRYWDLRISAGADQ